ncbi:DMT family transporter [Alphaproteobacteria bacterium]|nr:DMT family transporter [Alphaproteobacteria bacterium]
MTNAIQSQFSTKYKRGLFLVLMAGVLWSTVGLGIRMIQDANVWQILLYRSVSLSVFLAIVIYLRSGASPVVAVFSSNLNTHVAGMSLVAAYSGGIFAIQNTSVANAMLLFATAPFLAAILGLVVLREKVRAVTWFAILISLVGISIIIYDKTNGMALSGSLAALGSALGFAIFTVALRHGQAVDMLPSVFLSRIYAILITGSICALIDLKFVLGLSDGSIALGMGVFQVGAGLILYTVGSKILPAVELTLLSLAEVILGPVWVFLFLDETASVNTLIGGAIVLFAIAGNALAGARRKPPMID